MGHQAVNKMLQDNVKTWMQPNSTHADDGSRLFNDVREQYLSCLEVPNYTVFFNNRSAAQHDEDDLDKADLEIEEEYAGTSSSDNLGGPTAGVAGN